MASLFLSFLDKYGLFFFGRICNPVFDFFFAIKPYIALIITTIYKRLKRKLFGGAPLTFHWSYKRKIKIFPPIIQQGILQEVGDKLAVPQ